MQVIYRHDHGRFTSNYSAITEVGGETKPFVVFDAHCIYSLY